MRRAIRPAVPARRHLVARHRATGALVALAVRGDRIEGYLRLLDPVLPGTADLERLAYRDGAGLAALGARLADYELWQPLR